MFRDIYKKNKEGVRAIRAMKYKNMWLEHILAHAHLWRGNTQIDIQVKKWHNKYENNELY